MSAAARFEELKLWKEARNLANLLYVEYCSGTFAKDYELRNQISRSSGSVMDNIAEGFERGGNKEFIQFLLIAKGSVGEVRSQLYRAVDRVHLTTEKFEYLKGRCESLSKGMSTIIKYLKQSDRKGFRYH